MPPAAQAAGPIDRTLRFSVAGWSFFCKTSSGTGTVSCSSGQRATVTIHGRGGGLTPGRSRTTGRGECSGVRDSGDVCGSYATAEAHAGAAKAGRAELMTKADVSLASAVPARAGSRHRFRQVRDLP